MSATALGCMLDSVSAVTRLFGERQRITVSRNDPEWPSHCPAHEQHADERLLQQHTRSDDQRPKPTGGTRPNKRPVKALTMALWKAALESVVVKRGTREFRVMQTVAFWSELHSRASGWRLASATNSLMR